MTHDQIIAKALDIIRARFDKRFLYDDHGQMIAITGPDTIRNYLTLRLAESRDEHMGTVFLDNRHRILEDRIMFNGTIDGASVHPRVIVRTALELNAAAIILYHNHPSGVAEPSHADRALTKRVSDAASLVDVRVLDHFVIGADSVASFAERGWL